jgi:hypothetical protein
MHYDFVENDSIMTMSKVFEDTICFDGVFGWSWGLSVDIVKPGGMIPKDSGNIMSFAHEFACFF